MRIWLDDARPMPDGFDVWCKTGDELFTLLMKSESSCRYGTGQEKIEHISFDHDLGEDSDFSGYDIAKTIEKMAANTTHSPITWEIHSANPVGRANIERAMKSAERFWNDRGE